MEFVSRKVIQLDKLISELDRLVFKFVKVLEKHADYVIVSGYVSILFGRARATEGVDILIEELSEAEVNVFYEDLTNNGFWCLNSGDVKDIYSYLEDGLAVRFAVKGSSIPNFEVKFARKRLSVEALKDVLTVVTRIGKIRISSIERQIAFKRYYLKSDKDLEDAEHIERVFKGHVDKEKINKYRELISRDEKT